MDKEIEIQAAVFRRLLRHLDARKDVQNIELMNLAGFCRNCFSKWTVAEADKLGVDVDIEEAREQAEKITWNRIIQVMMLVGENLKELEWKKEKKKKK